MKPKRQWKSEGLTVEQRELAAAEAFRIAVENPRRYGGRKSQREEWWTDNGGKSPLKGGSLSDA